MTQGKPKDNKATETPLNAALDRITAAYKTVAEAPTSQNPVRASQDRHSAYLAKKEPPYQRTRADLRGLLPSVHRVSEELEALPRPRQDGPQRRINYAVRLAYEISDLITKDVAAEISREIDDLNPDRLRGGWEQYLVSRIDGLAHLRSIVEQKRAELEFTLAEIVEKDLPTLGEMKSFRAADAFVRKPQQMTETE